MKVTFRKLLLRGAAFMLILLTLVSALTLLFMPKWSYTRESGQVSGFFKEPRNTIDVLCLGSCNMYSSFSSVLMYEDYGITGYSFCCPDQEMFTSYHFLKEALKTQDLKAVVVESLFLTNRNTDHREHYDRFAMDYTPLSLNKLKLGLAITNSEVETMRQYDPTTSDKLLTYASYVFPLLRYHSRTDLTEEDVSFFAKNDLYNPYKGGFPEYNYTTNDDNYYNKVFNGDCINEAAREYFPKIKELCEKNGIQLMIMKSPNRARWGYDDTHTKLVRDFAAEMGVPFLDFHSEGHNNFEEYDYGYSTGRLNVYGVKKLSADLGSYLVDQFGLKPTELSEKNKAAWDDCVEWYYRTAEENGCNIEDGQLAQVSNQDNAIQVRWNPCDDCDSYSVYRCAGRDGAFEKIAEAGGNLYNDTDVMPNQGYSYYIVPNEGALSGRQSDTMYYVYVEKPRNFRAANDNGTVRLDWDEVNGTEFYKLQRRTHEGFNFNFYDYDTDNTYNNYSVTPGTRYYYRLSAAVKEGDDTYYSDTTIVTVVPMTTPSITSCSSSDGQITINWNALSHVDGITVLRRADNESEFTPYDTLAGDSTAYTDSHVTVGTQFFYQLVTEHDVDNVHAVSSESNTVGVFAKG